MQLCAFLAFVRLSATWTAPLPDAWTRRLWNNNRCNLDNRAFSLFFSPRPSSSLIFSIILASLHCYSSLLQCPFYPISFLVSWFVRNIFFFFSLSLFCFCMSSFYSSLSMSLFLSLLTAILQSFLIFCFFVYKHAFPVHWRSLTTYWKILPHDQG